MQQMPPRIIDAIDHDRYPYILTCIHCDGRIGHSQEVWTGNRGEDDKSGWEVWFCCHPCRDADRPCETFSPIRLKPGTELWY